MQIASCAPKRFRPALTLLALVVVGCFTTHGAARDAGRDASAAASPIVCAGAHVSFGADPRRDVPWFTLPRVPFFPIPGPPVGYAPLLLVPTGTVPPSTSPYTDPTTAGQARSDWNADNPPYSGYAEHANITRHWSSAPTYVIVVPPSAGCTPPSGPAAVCGTDVVLDFPTLAGLPGTAGYTWQNWIADVQATFAAYDGTVTAQIASTYGGVTRTDYRMSPTRMLPPFGSAGFTWAFNYISPFSGPTGNGVNEIILSDQFLGGGGLTSMIVDPATGTILEADVILDASLLFTQYAPNATTLPFEWTALRHEIGHFYGLDHTNLHPGSAAIQGTPNLTPAPGTLADFPAVPLPGDGLVPGMVGFITYMGAGYNHVLTPLHRDDGVALSKIYPVCVPSPPGAGPLKLPLINVSARIFGRQRDAGMTSTISGGPIGSFGRNVWAVEEGAAGAANVFPRSGTISGISRISATDGAFLGQYVRPALHPLPTGPAAGAEAYFLYPTSVVGATSITPTPPLPHLPVEATGDFLIDGLPPGSFDVPANAVAYEVVFEDAAYLGAGAGNQAEWFNSGTFYTGNPIAPFGTGAVAPVVLRNLFGAQLALGPAVSGMRVVPGTVIALDPREHDDLDILLNIPPFPMPSASGVAFGVTPESYVRPLVDIQPRLGRWSLVPVVVRMQATLPSLPGSMTPVFELAPNRTYVFLNGTLLGTILQIAQSQGSPTPILPGAMFRGTITSLTMTVPMSSILNHPAAQTPPAQCPAGAPTAGIRMTVIANLRALIPAAAPFAAPGRNDVIF